MVDRPIIFSAPMVLALLAGRKTQTRRLRWRKEGPMTSFSPPPQVASAWFGVQPGDRLWVREAWAPNPRGVMAHGAIYRAGHEEAPGSGPRVDLRWRPSIHMPRWASRLTLTVNDVLVQKLQEISEVDAQAEGVSPFVWVGRTLDAPHRYNFQLLWDELHGPGAWDANPEVAALTFTVQQGNIDA